LYFHSKKPEFLKQEIYANLTLYNFGIFIANEAAEENKKKERKNDNKYLYEIDISSALMQIMLKRNASSATAELLFHF